MTKILKNKRLSASEKIRLYNQILLQNLAIESNVPEGTSLTLLIAAITLGSGRATVMQGAVHLVLFAAFLFLTVVP